METSSSAPRVGTWRAIFHACAQEWHGLHLHEGQVMSSKTLRGHLGAEQRTANSRKQACALGQRAAKDVSCVGRRMWGIRRDPPRSINFQTGVHRPKPSKPLCRLGATRGRMGWRLCPKHWKQTITQGSLPRRPCAVWLWIGRLGREAAQGQGWMKKQVCKSVGSHDKSECAMSITGGGERSCSSSI